MAKSITKKLWGKVPMHKGAAPAGWVTIAEFSERSGGLKTPHIYKAIGDGRIPQKHLAINHPYGEQQRLIIDWDAVAYNFFEARRPAWRPEDFKINDAREYKPFGTTPQKEALKEEIEEKREEIKEQVVSKTETPDDKVDRIVNEQMVSDKMIIEPVIDVTTARYRKEQLEIEKRQIALKREANQLIDLDTERSILGGIAAELNGNANKAIPKWSPIFAAEDDPRKLRQLMKQMFVEIFKPLEVEDENTK